MNTNAMRRLLSRACLLSALLVLAACSQRVELQNGLSDAEANDVVSALQEDGIAAHKQLKKDGTTVVIPEAHLSRANAVLTARGLPKRKQVRLGEVFKKEGLISSPLEERARYLYALSQELEYTLAQFDGVIVARVHVVLPEKAAPGEPLTPSSAAVFIKHKADFDPDVVEGRMRQLVARSIPGLGSSHADKVSVVFAQGNPAPARRVESEDDGSTLVVQIVGGLLVAAAVGGLGWWQRARLNALLRKSEKPAAAEAAMEQG
jgi:type III secretion protein J